VQELQEIRRRLVRIFFLDLTSLSNYRSCCNWSWQLLAPTS